MDYQIQLVGRVEDIGQPAWDYISSEQPLAGHQWCRFASQNLVNETPPYLILSRNHEPLARAIFRVVGQDFLRTLRGSSGAYDIKQRSGFTPDSTHYARHTVQGRVMNWLA